MSRNPHKTKHKKKSGGFFASLFKVADLRAEKSRLEAFLNAVPHDYCGWGADGTVAYSQNFTALLGIHKIKDITDIQEALSTSDAAVLEGLFTVLQNEGVSFSAHMQTADSQRFLKLSGVRGQDLDGQESFDILWLEDITGNLQEKSELKKETDLMAEERDRLQVALDQLSFPIWMRDSHTKIIWCNRFYAQSLGESVATVIAEQKELPVKINKKSPQKKAGHILAQNALDRGAAQELLGHIIVEGRRRLMRIEEMPIKALHLTLGAAHDITRQEELEAEQTRHSSANKELLEQIGTAIGIFDAGERLEFYNSAFAQLWDLDDNYLNGRPRLGDLMEKLRETRRLPEQADFKKYKQSWLSMFTSLLDPYEEMLYLPNGSALRLLAIPHPLGGLMMTFEDVSSRLELESSYNTLIAVQKETLDNLVEGVVVFGGDGRLKLWNPAFAGLWSFNPEDLENEPHVTRLTEKMKPHFHDKEWPSWQKKIIAQSIGRKQQEDHLECIDGRVINYTAVPLPDGGVLVTHVDVTDKQNVENALREKNAALEEAEQLKLDFLANVSYQLRTPLNAITGFTEILSNEYFGPLNERQREYTNGMQEAGDRLVLLINDILDLSTIEAGYMDLNKDNVAVQEILDSVANLTIDWAREKKIELTIKAPKTIGEIHADPQRLKQVLMNLTRNAITFTPEGGEISLQAKKIKDKHGKEMLSFTITDSGTGIAKKDQERIFQPFEKGDKNNDTQSGGAGLGLSLVKNITELHGGTISLESDEGKGTCFTLLLPNKVLAKKTTKNKKTKKSA